MVVDKWDYLCGSEMHYEMVKPEKILPKDSEVDFRPNYIRKAEIAQPFSLCQIMITTGLAFWESSVGERKASIIVLGSM